MRWIVRILAGIGLLVILMVGLGIYAVSRLHIAGHAPTPIAPSSILTLTVEGAFVEEPDGAQGLPAAFSGRGRRLREVITGIDHAASDPRIKGLVIKIDGAPGMAQTQELRAAVQRFQRAGKFAYAFADAYGGGGANGSYYLASISDLIWLQPMGEVTVTGVAFEAPFVKDALAKLGVDPQFVKRSEYKTAPETFTERGFTPAAREMMESLASDLTGQLVAGVAESRKMPAEQVQAMLARGPLTSDEALDAHLVDRIGYADEVMANARKAGGDATVLTLADYVDQTEDTTKLGSPNIALIYAVGEIGQVAGPIEPNQDEDGVRGESVIAQGFAKAIADPSIKAIVLRVDSPGGSVSGSESIRRLVVRAKAAGKKLVVSMGGTAASGGYWISTDADKIVADAATLTGSIGVFTGKFVVGKGLADWGITTDRTADSGFAGMNSPFTPFTPEQLQRLNVTIDSVYDAFITRVAQGRKLPPTTVAQSAKGRVWTGQQAKQIGLVDEVGGLVDAVRLARELAAILPDEPTHLKVFPQPRSPLDTLRHLMDGNIDASSAATGVLANLNGPAGDVLRVLGPLFRDPRNQPLRMPDLIVR